MTDDSRPMNPEEPGKRRRSVPVTERKPSRPLKRMVAEEGPITLGSSRLSDYTKVSMLGKGTYGEVHKCVHKPSGMIVAMKTYMFEVRNLFSDCLPIERDQRHQLQHHARNLAATITDLLPAVCETS
jgi:hypothetical protein